MGRQVTLVRKDGSKLTTSEERAKKLEALGYAREETPEEVDLEAGEKGNEAYYSQPDQKVLTAAEGWISGALPGLGDVITTSLDPEGARARAVRNPGTRIAGELGSSLLGAAITGGSSSLAKGALGGAGGVAQAVGNKLGGRVVGTAAEGALLGVGSAVSESVLSGDPLTAESVLAHVGVGSLLGAGVAGANEVVLGGAKRYLAKSATTDVLPTSDLSKFYDSLPDEKVARFDKTPEWVKADKLIGDDYTEEFVSATDKVIPNYKLVRDANFSALRGAIDDVKINSKVVNEDIDATFKTLRAQEKEYKRAIESVAADYRAAVGVVRREAADNATSQAERKAIEAEFIDLEDTYKELSKVIGNDDPMKALNRLTRFKQKIKEHGYFKGPNGAALAPTPSADIALKLRDSLKAAEETVKLKLVAKELGNFPKTQEEFFKMRPDRLEKLAAAMDNANFDPLPINNMLKDAGLELTGSPGTKARALWEAGQNAFTKQSTPVKRAKFNLPGEVPVEPTVGKTVSSTPPKKPEWPLIEAGDEVRFQQGVGELVPMKKNSVLGFWQRAARLGMARKADQMTRGLGAGALGRSVAYEAAGNITASLLGGGFISGIMGMKGQVLGRVANAVDKYGPGVGRQAKKLAVRATPLAVRLDGSIDAQKDRRELLKQRSIEITNAGPGFKDATFMAVEPLVGEHTDFANAIHKSAVTAFEVLASYVPKDSGLMFSRLSTLWKPSDVQVANFEKAYAVYHDPVGTAEMILETGRADMTTVAALRDMYPAIYGELRHRVMDKLTNIQFLNSLTYGDQARLSIMMDIPIHSNFTSRSIAQSQAMYQTLKRPPSPTGSASGSGGRPAKSEPPTPAQSLIGQ